MEYQEILFIFALKDYMDNTDKIFISVLIVYWFITFIYMLKWHHNQGNLDIGTFLLAALIGPAIAPVVRNEMKEIKRVNTRERDDRWSNLRRFTIPPPPPISKKRKLDNYRLLRGYDKVR